MEIKTNKNKPEIGGIIPLDINYHRNGVGGQPFTSLRYDWHDEDLESTLDNPFPTRKMIATISEGDDTTCRVIDIENPDICWRGDRLAKDILAVMNKYETLSYVYKDFNKTYEEIKEEEEA